MGYWVIEQLRDLEYNETVASVRSDVGEVQLLHWRMAKACVGGV